MTFSDYSVLKNNIIKSVAIHDKNNTILNLMKGLFKSDINSPRRFESIESIGQLLKILETRDVLSEENVQPLKDIARKLPNKNDLMTQINMYETTNENREIVNLNTTINSQNSGIDFSESLINRNPCSGTLSPRKRELILQIISEQLGSSWRNVGRHLKIRECDIDSIDSQYKTFSEKSLTVMKKFEARADPQRWFFILCNALDKANRKDVTRDLQEVMSMNI